MKKHRDKVKSKFKERGLFKSLAKLHAKFKKTGHTIKLIIKYNAINDKATQIMLKAFEKMPKKILNYSRIE